MMANVYHNSRFLLRCLSPKRALILHGLILSRNA